MVDPKKHWQRFKVEHTVDGAHSFTSGSVLQKGNGAGLFTDATAGTDYQAPITTATGALSGDVTLTNADTYYSGPSVSLTAGTWLITATITVLNNDAAVRNAFAKLWNQTTVIGSTQSQLNASASESLSLSGIATVAGNETWEVAAATGTASGVTIKAALTANGAGNNASRITAIKVG